MKKVMIFLLFLACGYTVSLAQCSFCFAPNAFTPSSGSITSTSITISWSVTADYYQVYYRRTGTTSWTSGCGGSGTNCVQNNLVSGTTYEFRVIATNYCPEGCAAKTRESNIITATTSNPATPTGLFNSSVTQSGFTANWTAVPGAVSYTVRVYSGAVSFHTVTSDNNNEPITHASITAGNQYSWEVRANGGGSSASAYANGIIVTIIPPTPSGLSASGNTTTSFTANWSNVHGDDNYRLDVSTSNSFSTYVGDYHDMEVVGTSRSVTGLTAGVRYYYRVRSENAGGESGSSSPANTMTLTAKPTASSATDVTSTSFTARWNAPTGAASYELDVSADNFATVLPGYDDLAVTGTSQPVSGLTPGTAYKYRVRAVNAGGSSANSDPVDVTMIAPAPLTSVPEDITETSFTAKWQTANGATQYRLDVSSDYFATFVPGFENNDLVGTARSIENLTPGNTYQYRVRSFNGSGLSGNSDTVVVALIPPAPGIAEADAVGQTSFTAQWEAANGATEYRLDISDDDFETFLPGFQNRTITGNSHHVSDLLPGRTYAYRVRAVNSGGVSITSEPIEVTLIPATPEINSPAAIGQTLFTARWQASDGAAHYLLDVSADNFQTYIADFENTEVEGTSAVVNGLAAGNEFQYRVRAVNTSGASPESEPQTVLLVPANPVALEPSDVSGTSFTARWQEVSGASEYRLDVSEDDFQTFISGYNNLRVTETENTVATTLSPGKSYRYRVRAVNETGISNHSNVITVVLVPGKPVAIAPGEITQTSFSANWEAQSGATDYYLDVSADTFKTTLPGYADLHATTNSLVIADLSHGGIYQYRVRAANNLGTSENSNIMAVTLVPANPETFAASEITQTSLTATWKPVENATGYFLDVSPDNFETFVGGYEQLLVEGTSKNVTGLLEGVQYGYRVTALNTSGASGYSDVRQVITVPATPVPGLPENVSENGFLISWPEVTGATHYRLDVGTNSTFTNYVEGYQNKEIQTAQDEVTGLSSGLVYYVRVRSLNVSGVSSYSATREQITKPEAPVSIQVTEKLHDSFLIQWPAPMGAASYEVEVSAVESFETLLPDYAPKSVTGQSELAVTGLQPSTLYFVRIISVNAAGKSSYSSVKTVNTTSATGEDDFELSVQPPVFNPFYGSEDDISLTVAGGVGEKTITLYHRGITEDAFSEQVLVSATGNVQVLIEEQWFDDLGLEFYFTVTDQAQQEVSTAVQYIYRKVEAAIPFAEGGGELKHYRIIAMPYVLEDPLIGNLFEPILGAYDKSKWRLVRYQNGKNVDYIDGLSKTRMDRGNGYWFNARQQVNLQFGQAVVADNSQGKPFQLNLQPGWNQIGNPYPFVLDWDAVRDNNDPVVGPLLTYDHENISLSESTTLQIFEGAFVWADEAMMVEIPVIAQGVNAGGRISSNGRAGFHESHHAWFVPVTISQGELVNSIGGFGMHGDADEAKDRFDLPVVPHLVRFAEWKTVRGNSNLMLTRDVVPVAREYQWDVVVDHNSDEAVNLTWDPLSLPAGSLTLFDKTANTVLNMHKNDSYTFRGSARSFTISYNRYGTMSEKEIRMGYAFPNPAREGTTINYAVSANGIPARVIVRAATGVVVADFMADEMKAGVQQVSWDLRDNSGKPVSSGLYLFEVIPMGENVYPFHGRILVNR